jgi:hypothetical protein
VGSFGLSRAQLLSLLFILHFLWANLLCLNVWTFTSIHVCNFMALLSEIETAVPCVNAVNFL